MAIEEHANTYAKQAKDYLKGGENEKHLVLKTLSKHKSLSFFILFFVFLYSLLNLSIASRGETERGWSFNFYSFLTFSTLIPLIENKSLNKNQT
jgi:hypothetical protein